VYFEVVGEITGIEIIAVGNSIRDLKLLCDQFGRGRWRKLKGIAVVRSEGRLRKAELHWYEAHGIGIRKMKLKCFLD
jgi:hypothetical protein